MLNPIKKIGPANTAVIVKVTKQAAHVRDPRNQRVKIRCKGWSAYAKIIAQVSAVKNGLSTEKQPNSSSNRARPPNRGSDLMRLYVSLAVMDCRRLPSNSPSTSLIRKLLSAIAITQKRPTVCTVGRLGEDRAQ